MKKPIVAIDIDEVLVYHYEPLFRFHNKLFGTKLSVDDYTDDWVELWGAETTEIQRRFDMWHKSEDWKDKHKLLIDGAEESLSKLKKDFELVIITGRSQESAEFTNNWLVKTFPETFSSIHSIGLWAEGRGKTKAEKCVELGAKYLIDDTLEQAVACAKVGVKALLFGDSKWNKADKLPKGVTRVANWREVLQYFDGLKRRR